MGNHSTGRHEAHARHEHCDCPRRARMLSVILTWLRIDTVINFGVLLCSVVVVLDVFGVVGK